MTEMCLPTNFVVLDKEPSSEWIDERDERDDGMVYGVAARNFIISYQCLFSPSLN